MLFICYPKCTTCKKAKKWLEDNGIEYTQRHIVEDNPTVEELNRWQTRSGLPLKKFFNTSGMLYRELQLKDKLPEMSREEQLERLIKEQTAKNPRELAGKLMDGLLEACRNHASDDMTVYVAGIWRKSESVLYA